MAIQDDNTILNKGDLKAYHEAIAPMLGGTFMVSTNNSDFYSTDEKIVGVWIDGKPLYQKTFDMGNNKAISYTAWTSSGITSASIDLDRIVAIFAASTDQTVIASGIATCIKAHVDNGIIQLQTVANYSDETRYFTMQYTKTTDTASTALTTPGAYDINFPNTWPANTEIYFGNGLYGQRFTGTVTTPANTITHTVMGVQIGAITVVSCGGTWDRSVLGNDWTQFPINSYYDSDLYCSVNYNKTSRGFELVTKNGSATANVPYNVWVTYTK